MQETYCEADLETSPVKSEGSRMEQRKKLNYDLVSIDA